MFEQLLNLVLIILLAAVLCDRAYTYLQKRFKD